MFISTEVSKKKLGPHTNMKYYKIINRLFTVSSSFRELQLWTKLDIRTLHTVHGILRIKYGG
jgi:hypothetical protein